MGDLIVQAWRDYPTFVTAAGLVAAVALLAYAAAPLLVFRTMRLRANPVRRMRPGEVPPGVAGACADDAAWLRASGFEHTNDLLIDGGEVAGSKVLLWVSTFADRANGHNAAIIVPPSVGGEGQFGRPKLAFTTLFDDGTEVQTQDDSSPTTLPQPPRKTEWHVSGLGRDELLRLHVARIRHRPEPAGAFARSDVRCLADPECEASDQTLLVRHAFGELVALGAMRPTGEHEYAMTLGRAYLATWRLLPPVKQFVHRGDNRRARRLLASAEGDRPSPTPRVKIGLPRYFDQSPVRRDADLSAGEFAADGPAA